MILHWLTDGDEFCSYGRQATGSMSAPIASTQHFQHLSDYSEFHTADLSTYVKGPY